MSNRVPHLGIQIHKDDPSYINNLSETLFKGHYLKAGETISEALARPATAFCAGDLSLAQRIYEYVYDNWFMYASPVLSNAPEGVWDNGTYTYNDNKPIGLPISCFGAEIPDTAKGQVSYIKELAELSMAGGGMGAHNSIRGTSVKAPGPIPYLKMVDGAIGYFKQSGSRRGAVAAYMNVDHPDITEHIRFRIPGGDSRRRSDNRQQFHSAVNITDKFKDAVLEGKDFDLVCPHSGRVFETVPARSIWEDIIETRALTGEPYLMKIDLVNRRMPETQKELGLTIKGSNLCSEITLPTDDLRTFVCCLSSLNLEKFEEWKDTTIVEDLIRFLDNVLQYFIDNAPGSMSKAKYSATRERALGLGTFGWHSLLQSKMIPFCGGGFGSAVQLTHQVYGLIKSRAVAASRQLAIERGEAPDMEGTGMRNSRLMAIAPNASSADLAGTSPSIEPWYRNIYVKDSWAGSFVVKNKYLERLLESKGMNTQGVWDSILAKDGSARHLEGLTEHEKSVFDTANEMDQHWLIEMADQRGGYICQAQSLNLFIQAGMTREYVNSIHLKFLKSDNVMTLYYLRNEREGKVDTAKAIERKALIDWSEQAVDCVACQG